MAEKNKRTNCQLNGARIVWDINYFQNWPRKEFQCLLSPIFRVAGDDWEFRLYPKSSPENSYLSLFVENITKNRQIVVEEIMLKINDYVIASYRYNTSKMADYWGCSDFLMESIFLKYLQPVSSSKTVTVVCTFCNLRSSNEGTVTTEAQYLDECCEKLADDLNSLFLSNELCDVIIKAGLPPKEFKAHKAILAARSPVFLAMFKHEMRENVNDAIDIPDCDPISFADFLQYLYTGKVDNKTNGNVLGLYEIADKYAVEILKGKCVFWITKGLEVETICDVLNLSATREETELLKSATDFFIQNAAKVFNTEKWIKFMDENPYLARSILLKLSLSKTDEKNTMSTENSNNVRGKEFQ